MKTLLLVITAVFILSLPTLAGPLTGAPAIKFEVGAPEAGATAEGTWALGVGYTTFNFELGMAGTKFSWDQSGPIISGEYSKAIGETGTKSVAFGGWIAPVGSTTVNGTNMDGLTMGEAHFRYGFNKNWGVEVGTLFADAADNLGKMLVHAVWQTETTSEKPVKAQVGLGLITGADFGDLKGDTGGSFFANVSYPFSESVSGYLSVWSLFQNYKWQGAWSGLPDVEVSTIQWSLGASHSF